MLIQKLRLQRGWSQEDLAALSGLSVRTIQRLERGQLDLEASIAAYERGTALRRHCATKLDEARLRVEKITFDKNGQAKLEPFGDE